MAVEELIEAEVVYGMGATCSAVLPKRSVEGASARDLIGRVISLPQSDEPATRAARVLSEVLQSGRTVDIEVSKGRNGQDTPSTPVLLDDIVVPAPERTPPVPEKVVMRISEAYVGG